MRATASIVLCLLISAAITVGAPYPQDPTPKPKDNPPPAATELKLDVPKGIEGTAGRLIKFTTKGDYDRVVWYTDFDTSDTAEVDLEFSDSGKSFLFNSPVPGTYRFFAYATKDKQTTPITPVTITLKDRLNPNPKSQLYKALQTAFRDDPSPTKTEDTKALIQVYRAVAQVVYDPATKLSQTKTAKSVGQTLKTTTVGKVGTKLTTMRDTFADDFGRSFDLAEETDLPAATQAAMAETFNRYASVLEELLADPKTLGK